MRSRYHGTKTLASSSGQINYSLDPAGNLTSDGLRQFDYDSSNRHQQTRVGINGEASKISYLHNAAGQRVFKSEPQIAQTLPDETTLGATFTDWLKKNFSWLYAAAQSNATLGQSYVYGDNNGIPSYALLAEYGNGAASGAGRSEYIWLPTDNGNAIPVGIYKGARFYAVHADQLNTPRWIQDDTNKTVWQWPYSAFGDNKPTGILKATPNPNNAYTQDPTTNARLQATNPNITYNLRYPGQYFDSESNLNYNYFRSYRPVDGRYTQNDPIGLDGGWNRYGYVGGNPLSRIDPLGLDDFPVIYNGGAGTLWVVPPGSKSTEGFPAGNNTTSSSRGPWAPGTYTYGYPTTHKDDAPASAYGSNGNTVFNVPGCIGCGVHSGRQDVLDKRGGSGVQHVTEGCIRTTDDATKLIQDLIRQGHRPVLEVTR